MLLFVTQIEMSYVKTYRIHIELNLIATLCINVEIGCHKMGLWKIKQLILAV